MILGRTEFIKKALNRIKEEELNREDISCKKVLKAECRPMKIYEIMSNVKKLSRLDFNDQLYFISEAQNV